MFNTTCEFCKASLPAWKEIASEFGGNNDVQVIGVSIRGPEETEAFIAQHKLLIPVVSFSSRKLRALYRSTIVPQTLVLDSTGLIEYARVGAVTEDATVDSIIMLTNQVIGSSTENAAVPIDDVR